MVTNTLKGIYAFLFLCVTAVCGEICYYIDESWNADYIDCSTGCCGNSYSRYCCTTSVSGVGVIMAVMTGCVAFVAMVMAIIFCCRKARRSSQVRQPATTARTDVNERQTSNENTQQGSCQPGNGQPRYSQPGYGQPGYGQGGYTNQGFPWHTQTSNMQSETEQNWETSPPPYEQNLETPPPPYESPPPYEPPLTASRSQLRWNALDT